MSPQVKRGTPLRKERRAAWKKESMASHWTIEHDTDGDVWEVRQGNRRKHSAGTVEAAMRWLKGHHGQGEKVVLVEEDGYRLNITSRFA